MIHLCWHCAVRDMNISYHGPNFLPEKCTLFASISICTEYMYCKISLYADNSCTVGHDFFISYRYSLYVLVLGGSYLGTIFDVQIFLPQHISHRKHSNSGNHGIWCESHKGFESHVVIHKYREITCHSNCTPRCSCNAGC